MKCRALFILLFLCLSGFHCTHKPHYLIKPIQTGSLESEALTSKYENIIKVLDSWAAENQFGSYACENQEIAAFCKQYYRHYVDLIAWLDIETKIVHISILGRLISPDGKDTEKVLMEKLRNETGWIVNKE